MSVQRDRLAEDLLTFARLAPTAASEHELQHELMRRLQPFGVTHVAAGVMMDSQRRFKFQKGFGRLNVAWTRQYLSRQLYRHDPVINHALLTERSVYWDRAYSPSSLTRPAERVLGIAADVGVRDGFMAPLPLFNGDIMVVSFQGERLDRDPDVEALMGGMALYYGAEGQKRLMQTSMTMSLMVGATARQIEVLHLAAVGRKNWEIGEALGISENTVEFHLKRVRERLNVSNTKEAVAILRSTPHSYFEKPYGKQ